MGTCKTCRYWGGKDDKGSPIGFRTCAHPKVGGHQDTEPDGCHEAEGYFGIPTGPNFGCIHHTPATQPSEGGR